MNVHRNQRVMFVDDEEGVRTSWNRYLSAHGFDVATAEDGERAISRLTKEPADVVVADLRMPGLNGLQLLEWLNQSQPDTRFILLTGYGSDEVEQKARELGAYEYLNKPVSPETLSAIITAALHLNQPKPAEAVAETAEPVAAVATMPAVVPRRQPSTARNVVEILGGLLLAPFLGLAFVIFLPVIGFGMLFWVGAKALRKRRGLVKA